MKKILSILIFCSLLFQCLAHYSVRALFELRKDYIAKNLCENRNHPELKCCGKCYLRKQLKKVDDSNNDSKNTPLKVEKQEAVAYILPVSVILPTSFVPEIIKPFNSAEQRMYHHAHLSFILRPPIFLG